MRIDPKGSYFMPVSVPQRPIKAGVFNNVTMISATYETSKDAMAELLPLPFEPADDPVVSVYYASCPKCNFLAGGGYNLIGVDLATHFNGKKDHLAGNYIVVLWEDNTNPVIRGRDLLGVPKLVADVPDFTQRGNTWQGLARDNNNLLLEVKVRRATPRSRKDVDQINRTMKRDRWMSWKYIPNVNGKGAAVSHPTLIGRQLTVSRSWQGDGEATYGKLTHKQSPWHVDIVNTLRKLKVKEYREGTVNKGTMSITRALNRVLK